MSYPAAPDATLIAALARISAAIPPSVRVNTGSMAPLPLHLYADLVSRTGAGKSTAIEAAMKAIEVCPEWADDALGLTPDGVLIPVGEPFPHVAKPRTSAGIAEQFWGMIPDLMDPKKKARARVRSNVLLLTDEGSGLIKHIRDDKETVGETLREAWSGTLIGQSNADYMKYRPVEPGTYTIALVTGMQLSVLGQLLSREELEKGTPQRFIYSWCKPNPAEVTAESIAAVVAPDHPLEVKSRRADSGCANRCVPACGRSGSRQCWLTIATRLRASSSPRSPRLSPDLRHWWRSSTALGSDSADRGSDGS
ncbi:hypothetical protein GS536_17185 [Rhodococcus hoagii]|nr:hypothetical protein [Prescottella equi]